MASSDGGTGTAATRMVRTFQDSFSPLAIRNFRVYLSGQAVSLVGTWLQMTAAGWLVWELSQSPAALGIVAMLGSLPILVLGPWTGVWADRLNRRVLLIVTQVGAMLIAFALAALVGAGVVQIWHVYIASILLGTVAALDMPAQQAFLGDLAGMEEVRRAVVLNSMIFQASRMIGPALAALVIGALGTATAFWLNGLSFLAVIASLLMVHPHQFRASHLTSTWEGFRDGVRFIAAHPRIQDLILFAVLITFLGLPIINLYPAVASQVLNGDATTLGWLLAASGAGALVGVVFVVPITNSMQRTGLVLGSAVMWIGAWSLAFSFSTQMLLSMLSRVYGRPGRPAGHDRRPWPAAGVGPHGHAGAPAERLRDGHFRAAADRFAAGGLQRGEAGGDDRGADQQRAADSHPRADVGAASRAAPLGGGLQTRQVRGVCVRAPRRREQKAQIDIKRNGIRTTEREKTWKRDPKRSS